MTQRSTPEAPSLAATSQPRWRWGKVAWLYAMLIPSLALGWWALSWERALITAAFGLTTLCLGHSVGLHRGVIHQAYEAPRWWRNFLLYLATLTGVGGPISMIWGHYLRDYWQNQPECPPYFAYEHGLLKDYIWNLHMSLEPGTPSREVLAPYEADPWLRFLEATWPLHSLGLAVLLLVLGGWESVVVGVCMRVCAGIFGHWAINFVTHNLGYVRYTVEGAVEVGRNAFLLGVVSFGEGFHNNHHAYPGSARMGHKPWELDLGWLAIRAMERLGLAHHVKAYGRHDDGRSPRAVEHPKPTWRWF